MKYCQVSQPLEGTVAGSVFFSQKFSILDFQNDRFFSENLFRFNEESLIIYHFASMLLIAHMLGLVP